MYTIKDYTKKFTKIFYKQSSKEKLHLEKNYEIVPTYLSYNKTLPLLLYPIPPTKAVLGAYIILSLKQIKGI